MNAPAGGISIDVSRMNRVIAVNAEDLDCVIEPGITEVTIDRFSLVFTVDDWDQPQAVTVTAASPNCCWPKRGSCSAMSPGRARCGHRTPVRRCRRRPSR